MADITNQKLLDSIAQMFVTQAEQMATKDDLKNFATKDDIANMATKDDLKELGARMRSDFNKLGARFEDLDHKFDTALEAIDKDIKLRRRVDRHGHRISKLEADSKLYKLAIKQLSSK